MSSSIFSSNKLNNIYVLGKDFIQGFSTIGSSTIYVEKLYKTNMTEPNKEFVLSLHYNGDDCYLFVNGGQDLKFKAQPFSNDIKQEIFCIGNLSTDWSSTNSTKTGLYGNVYDFVDYQPNNGVKTIYDINRYLMTKHNI